MANKKEIKVQLPQIIDELNLINGQLFQLKQGAAQLVEAVEKGAPIEHMKQIIEIFKIKETIESLQIKD
jgi:hypothetical protein